MTGTEGTPPPERVLVVAPGWLGDAVMALPALGDVRAHFPTARLAVAARGRLATLFERVPGVDEIVTLSTRGGSWARARADARQLAEGRFSLAVLFPNSLSSAWTVWQAAIPERWGYRADARGWLLTRSVPRPRPRLHQGAYYQHLVRTCGIPTGPLEPQVAVSAADRNAARRLLVDGGWVPDTPLVAMAPGAAYGSAKRWPAAYFGRLAGLLAQAGVSTVIDGVAADRAVGRAVEAAFGETVAGTEGRGASDSRATPGRLINVVGRTTLHQLGGVLGHCRGFVGNDSGAGHLAAAVGLPVVMIFGPTDERIGAPLPAPGFVGQHAALSEAAFCRPCWLRECVIDHRCMTRIPPERVRDVMKEQWPANGDADRLSRP